MCVTYLRVPRKARQSQSRAICTQKLLKFTYIYGSAGVYHALCTNNIKRVCKETCGSLAWRIKVSRAIIIRC